MEVGIVGLPNVGKSTIFNALTNAGALAANYPFATIEPNVGVVAVPDDRLEKIRNVHRFEEAHPGAAAGGGYRGHRPRGVARAKAWATNSCRTSAKWMRCCTWCGALKAATSRTWRAASIRCATSTRSTPS